MANRIDFLKLASEAEDCLAGAFGLVKPSTVVVSRRVAGSAYGAQFDHARNVIFVDPQELKLWDDLEIVHTMGEEVGHGLHFILRPDIFLRAKPTKDAVIQAVEEGRHGEQIRDAILSSNLIELIGFLAGLTFLEDRFNHDAANAYCKRSEPYLEPWTMAEGLALVDYFANLHAGSVSRAFEASPVEWRANAEAARPNTLPKDANELMIQLTHRVGYRLALDVHAQSARRQKELFEHALRVDSVLEFYERAGLSPQCHN